MNYIKFLPYIIAVVGALSLAGVIYWKGNQDGVQKVERVVFKEKIESEQRYEKKRQEIINLDRPDLHKRYCKWVRDSDYNECLQTNIYVD